MSLWVKRLAVSGLMGVSMVGLAVTSNPKETLAPSTKIATGLLYPLVILPTGLLAQGVVDRLTYVWTDYRFRKHAKEQPERMRSYLFNKRYMFVDLGVNQLVYKFLVAGCAFYFLKWADERLAKTFVPKPKEVRFRKELTPLDWLLLAKIRWGLILAKIAGEFFLGYREVKGRNSAKAHMIFNITLNFLWQGAFIQTFLGRERPDPKA